MTSRHPTVPELIEAITLVTGDADLDASLAALNYCMGALIRDHFQGDETALRRSDEQTRFVAVASNHNQKLH